MVGQNEDEVLIGKYISKKEESIKVVNNNYSVIVYYYALLIRKPKEMSKRKYPTGSLHEIRHLQSTQSQDYATPLWQDWFDRLVDDYQITSDVLLSLKEATEEYLQQSN